MRGSFPHWVRGGAPMPRLPPSPPPRRAIVLALGVRNGRSSPAWRRPLSPFSPTDVARAVSAFPPRDPKSPSPPNSMLSGVYGVLSRCALISKWVETGASLPLSDWGKGEEEGRSFSPFSPFSPLSPFSPFSPFFLSRASGTRVLLARLLYSFIVV